MPFLVELERLDPEWPQALSIAEQIEELRKAYQARGFSVRKLSHVSERDERRSDGGRGASD